MTGTPDLTSPYQIALTLIQSVTWPAIIGAAFYIVRFFNRLDKKFSGAAEQFNEIHKAVTNHLLHDVDECLQLLRNQDARFEQWMITQAAVAKQAQAHHGD